MLSLYVIRATINKVINDKGNRITLNLTSSIDLSKEKYKLRLLQASIVYCMPNIKSKNNLFKYSYNGTNYTYNIPVRLNSLDSLNKTISIQKLKQVGNEYAFYLKQMMQQTKF